MALAGKEPVSEHLTNKIVRLFAYSLQYRQTLDVMAMSEQEAQALMAVARGYYGAAREE